MMITVHASIARISEPVSTLLNSTEASLPPGLPNCRRIVVTCHDLMYNAAVDGCQDEQCLEHDGEVVPVLPHRLEGFLGADAELARDAVEDVCHADGERDRPSGSTAERFLRQAFVIRNVLRPAAAAHQQN